MARMLLLAVALAVGGPWSSPAAQSPAPPLEMLGLAPGIPQSELQDRVAKLGSRLSCKVSTVDRRFAECTATIDQVAERHRWELRASLVDTTSAVILLKTSVTAKELDTIRNGLAQSLGRPNYRKQGSQTSYEWVRAGRMMRLTSRTDRDGLQLSVSLVDGGVLDALNAGR